MGGDAARRRQRPVTAAAHMQASGQSRSKAGRAQVEVLAEIKDNLAIDTTTASDHTLAAENNNIVGQLGLAAARLGHESGIGDEIGVDFQGVARALPGLVQSHRTRGDHPAFDSL